MTKHGATIPGLNRLLVRLIPLTESVTKGGIILQESAESGVTQEAEVRYASPICVFQTVILKADGADDMTPQVRDIVRIPLNAGLPMKVNGEDLVCITYDEVLCHTVADPR